MFHINVNQSIRYSLIYRPLHNSLSEYCAHIHQISGNNIELRCILQEVVAEVPGYEDVPGAAEEGPSGGEGSQLENLCRDCRTRTGNS